MFDLPGPRGNFDKDVDEGQATTVAHALDVAMDWFENKRKQNFLAWEWFPRPKIFAAVRRSPIWMDDAIYALIQERRDRPDESGDLLTMLMQARDEATGEGTTSCWVMHRSPNYFDQANRFMPDRWENDLSKLCPSRR